MADKTQTKIIAENLSFYRKLHGLTQAELAEAIGYSDKSVSKWERGEGLPDILLFITLSEIYGITVSELVGQANRSKDTKEKIKAHEKDKKERERAKKEGARQGKKA